MCVAVQALGGVTPVGQQQVAAKRAHLEGDTATGNVIDAVLPLVALSLTLVQDTAVHQQPIIVPSCATPVDYVDVQSKYVPHIV